MSSYYVCTACELPIKMGQVYHTSKGYFHETCRPRYYFMHREFIDKHSFKNYIKAGGLAGGYRQDSD